MLSRSAYFDDSPAGTAQIPLRSEIPAADTWDLTPLYPDDAAWEADLEVLRAEYPRAASFRRTLGTSPEALLAALEFEKSLGLKIERLNHYASLKAAEDSSIDVNLARESKLQNLYSKIGEALAFIEPEIQAIPDDTFSDWLQAPALAPWRTALHKRRRYKPHTLTEEGERILALAATSLWGHSETFSQLTNVDMKFGKLRDASGAERELSQSSFSSFLIQRDPAVRKAAFHQFYAEFSDHRFTLAASLSNSVRTDVFRARARGYPSALEAALFHDDVPVSVYDNLIASVRANLAPLFRYYELRKRVLGLPEIHHYDTYVPLVSEIEKRTTFDEAIALVLDSLAPLGAGYTDTLADGLRHRRWCDRYESKGKRSGAFSSSSYGNPPYILMNFKEDVFADVFTLAHEAGHSMHSWYSMREQSFQDYDYPIFLAEVASTFNEELLIHRLLEITDDKAARAYIINRQLDDIRGTIYRQTMFAEFEREIHRIEEAGEALTLEAFRATYRGLLETYFGPGFALDAELELECLRIPHFYGAFYVYKYATGLSAAIALSGRVLRGEPGALDAYLGFLKSGGSKFPIPALRDAGVDMTSPGPVEDALGLFARRVDELEALLA